VRAHGRSTAGGLRLIVSLPSGLTVITLCRDNPAQLRSTLAALPQAALGLPHPWSVLVVDGSDGVACAQVSLQVAAELGLRLQHERLPPRGIYAAMNEAVAMVTTELLAFMNAGDAYLPGGLAALVQHWIVQDRPVAVFGQALVQPVGAVRPWLTPNPAMRKLERWLTLMVPCHQAFLFQTTFARQYLYQTDSLQADRKVMREALAQTGPGAYLREVVCLYDLGGASSELPTTSQIVMHLRDHRCSYRERYRSLIKAGLMMLLSSRYVLLMRVRAALWGWCCQ